MLADETIVETLGQVRVKSVQLPQFYPALYEQADLAIAEDPTAQEVDQAEILSATPDDVEDTMIFHVLENLVCDVILGEEFLEQMDAFNTCGIIERESDDYDSSQSVIPLYTSENFRSSVNHSQNMCSHQYSFANHGQLSGQTSNLIRTNPSLDSLVDLSNAESPEFYSLNPFVNLGPVQSLNTLTNKNKLKSSTTGGKLSGNTLALARQDHAERIEAEMYRHNNAERLIARMKDDSQKAIAQKAENAKREAFQNRLVGCSYCTGVPTSSVCGITRSGSSSQTA